MDWDNYDEQFDDFGPDFADPGGRSALRAETGGSSGRCPNGHRVGKRASYCSTCGTKLNPRIHPCPNCDRPGLLTEADKSRGYVCDGCADARERGGWGYGEY